MSAKSKKTAFKELDHKIRKLLDQRLGQGVLSSDDLLVICLELGEAKTEKALQKSLTSLSKRYEVLKDLIVEEKAIEREALQSIVKDFMSEFIKEDPAKAAKLGEMALKKDVTEEELFEFSPEFENFYKKKQK